MIQKNPRKWKKRLLISTPTLGLVRYEWAHARFGQIIPVNWEASGFDVRYLSNPDSIFPTFDPIGYSVEDAYNLISKKAIELGVDWLMTIEDDVLIPPDTFVKFGKYMDKGDIPIVTGLYYLKAEPTQPLVFRGRGNGSFTNFKLGQKVWCDGICMGCLLIHTSILKWFWQKAEIYQLPDGNKTRRIFDTPRRVFVDPESMSYMYQMGTQDLDFCDRIIDNKVLKETGWKKVARKKYPFLCDTSILARHIDLHSGRIYP